MVLSARLAPALRRLAPPPRLVRDERGVVAIEFAILALPFLAFLLAIIETSIVLFAGQALDAAVTKSARLIRTGQAQTQFDKDGFRAQVCSDVKALLGENCPGLIVDVTKLDDFSGFKTLALPIDATGDVKKDFAGGWEPGEGGEIVAVRAFYEWPLFVKLFGLDLSNLANGNRVLTAVSVFRNEPFP